MPVMIAAVWLLANWIAGPACLALFLPVYLVRVPREERLMLDYFGAHTAPIWSARVG
ncbi:MAG TPA: hypothetical protein VIO36_03170 [Anaerolineaceae bacterium]